MAALYSDFVSSNVYREGLEVVGHLAQVSKMTMMRSVAVILTALGISTLGSATTLTELCTSDYISSILPDTAATNLSITFDASSATANPVTGASVKNSPNYPDGTFDYCNVTFAYSHNGRNDRVQVQYWLPTPDNFQNRYLSTGGGGYAINSGNGSLPGGILYGAAAGLTDGGFGSFTNQLNVVNLLANGTLNYDAIFSFGYKGIHELSIIGKQLTRQFFNMTDDTKLYAYYQGCSEGGREGWSQVRRYHDQFDGVITGAPAFRFAHQQVQHLYSNVVEQTLNYYPSACELRKVLNATIAACDPLDGRIDGVVARTDLCKLQFNLSSVIGQPFSCPATAPVPFPPAPALPAINGTVSAETIAVAEKVIDGLRDSQGRQAYFSYQPSSEFSDAVTEYNQTSGEYELFISSLGGVFITRYLQLRNASNLETLDGVTYDTLVDWITQGWMRYEDTLQTTWPDLTPYHQAGGKVLHYHGESDFSIPTASSVRYWESVRSIMYPGLSYNESTAELSKWYRLFLVPGAGHCSPSATQPEGPYPQTNLAVLINWVEKDTEPTTLNATHLGGQSRGQNAQLCAWPLRPLYSGDSMQCVYDQDSLDTWSYTLDAFKVPVY